jgi:hypothetical protein
MNKANLVFVRILVSLISFVSFEPGTALALEQFPLGESGMPLSVPGLLLMAKTHTDEETLTDNFQLGYCEGQIFFSTKKVADDQVRLVLRAKGNRDRAKDVKLGKFPKTQVQMFFRRVPAENALVMISLGNGLWSVAKYSDLVADYTIDGDVKLTAWFEIASIREDLDVDTEKNGKNGVYSAKLAHVSIPFSRVEDSVFPLSMARFVLPKEAQKQNFFLETAGETPYPVIVLGYQNMQPEDLYSQEAWAYVVSRRDLELHKTNPAFFSIPVPFLRIASAKGAAALLDRARRSSQNAPPQWLNDYAMNPKIKLPEGKSFSQSVSILRGAFYDMYGGLSVPYDLHTPVVCRNELVASGK